jgi:hypothetical protein
MRASLLALALALLVFAAPAHAGSSESTITSPSDPTFPVDTGGGTLHVTGHTDFSPIDIICTYASGSGYAEAPTPSTWRNLPGGDFSVDLALDTSGPDYYACQLHAVPSGTTHPSDLSPFTGPRIGVAYQTFDPGHFTYDLEVSPFGGYAEFGDSADTGGITSTYGEDPSNLAETGELFASSDWLDTPSPATDAPRAAVQVDSQNAYLQSDIAGLYDGFPTNPAPQLNVDPATGLGSVSTHEALAFCSPGGSFPPTTPTCQDGVASGVRLDHSASMAADGALAYVNDQFTSTDGAAHTVDVWLVQQASVSGSSILWRFPGDPGFTDYSSAANPTLASGPNTALLDEVGQGFGSFSWSDAPDAVSFVNGREFGFHYTFTVPAGGSHLLRFAYGSSFTQSGAVALGGQAVAAFQPVTGPTPPVVTPPAITPPVTPSKTRLKFSANSNGSGTVTITFTAPGPGSLSGLETAVVPRSARAKTKKLTVSRARKKVTRAGTVKLVLKLNMEGAKIFRAKHRLRTTLAVTFKPTVGSATKLTPKHLTLKLKRKRHH